MSYTRPCFKINNQKYVSAGAMLYTIKDGKIFFMMQKIAADGKFNCTWEWEDFGGKSEKGDRSIKEVAVRECWEELNGKVEKEFLHKQIADEMSFRCKIPQCKYMLYVIYVPPDYMDRFTTEIFGDMEDLDKVKRTVHWIGYDMFYRYVIAKKVTPRLKGNATNLIIRLASKGDFARHCHASSEIVVAA